MHHGTCVKHVPWCMSGSLTSGDEEHVPGMPGACAPTILPIWQEAHGRANIAVISRRSWYKLPNRFPHFYFFREPCRQMLLARVFPWFRDWRIVSRITDEFKGRYNYHQERRRMVNPRVSMHLYPINSYPPGQNGFVFRLKFHSLKFVPKGSIDNIQALFEIMAWRRTGDKPLSK